MNDDMHGGGALVGDPHGTSELTRLNDELATARRELAERNAELARLDEQKNQFLGRVAHDLRNPLGAIAAYSELLLDEAAPRLSAEHVELLSLIKSLSEFMLRLVTDLVDRSTSRGPADKLVTAESHARKE